jgi:hypothetical protein
MAQDTSRTSTTFRNLNFENLNRFEIKNLENLQNDAVVYSSFDNKNFYFNIPLIFEKKYFSIFEIAKKIQFIGIDSASFEENYKIPVLNKTLNNFYRYQKTNVYDDFFNNSEKKSYYLKYNDSLIKKENSLIKKECLFSLNNLYEFIEDDSRKENSFNFNKIEDTNIKVLSSYNEIYYNFRLDNKTSSLLLASEIKNARIVFLNDKDNILLDTGVFNIDFKSLFENKKINSNREFIFYSLNEELEKSNLALNPMIDIEKDNFENSILFLSKNISFSFENIENIDIVIRYITDSGEDVVIAMERIPGQNFKEENIFIYNTTDLMRTICLDWIEEKIDFLFNIDYNVYYRDQGTNNTQSLNFSYEKSFKRSSSFINSIFNLFKDLTINFYLNQITINKEIKLRERSVKCTLKFNELDFGTSEDNVLNRLVFKNFKVNGSEVINFYKSRDLQLEKRYNSFTGESIRKILNGQDYFVFYIEDTNVNISEVNSFSFSLSLNSIEKQFTSNILVKRNYNNYINLTNKLFKENIEILEPIRNYYVDIDQPSIFNYTKITLKNVNKFKDMAYNFGYINSNSGIGDEKTFLENCIIKIVNKTKINYFLNKNNTSNYYFLGNVFDTSDEEKRFSYRLISDSFRDVLTRDYDYISNSVDTKFAKNIDSLDFFFEQNKNLKIEKASKIKDIKLKSSIEIEVLPIPYTVSLYRGKGTDDLGNPVDSFSWPDVTSDQKRLLSKDISSFIYENNVNLDYTAYLFFVQTFMSPTLSGIPSSYREIFESLVEKSIDVKNKATTVLKDEYREILNYLDTNREEELYSLENFLENIRFENYRQKFFNFEYKNNYNVQSLIKSFPITISYRNMSIDNLTQHYITNQVEFIVNKNNNVLFDINNFKQKYKTQDLLASNVNVKMMPFFLIKIEEDFNKDSFVENDYLEIVSYNNEEFFTFKNDLLSLNFGNFSNYLVGLNENVKVINIEENLFVKINSSNITDIFKLKYRMVQEFITQCLGNSGLYFGEFIYRIAVSLEILDREKDKEICYTLYYNIPLKINNEYDVKKEVQILSLQSIKSRIN